MRIIARDGVRALTHRAVDREAGLSAGSSSYYVPTRKALTDLIVQTLVERSIADAESAAQAATRSSVHPHTINELTAALAGIIDAYASRSTEMRTRYALLLELDPDDPVRATLSQRSPVQQRMLDLVIDALDRLKVSDAATRAAELLMLTDALLAHRVITGSDTSSTVPIVTAYLHGLTTTH